MNKTDSKILAEALHILARDIQSGDGVANAAISEGAHRIEELETELAELRKENEKLREQWSYYQELVRVRGHDSMTSLIVDWVSLLKEREWVSVECGNVPVDVCMWLFPDALGGVTIGQLKPESLGYFDFDGRRISSPKLWMPILLPKPPTKKEGGDKMNKLMGKLKAFLSGGALISMLWFIESGAFVMAWVSMATFCVFFPFYPTEESNNE